MNPGIKHSIQLGGHTWVWGRNGLCTIICTGLTYTLLSYPEWVHTPPSKFWVTTCSHMSSGFCTSIYSIHWVGLKEPRISFLSSFPFFFSIPSFLSPFHLGKSLWGNLKALLQNIQVCFPSGNAWASFRRYPTCCETGRLPVFVSDGFQFESRIECFQSFWMKKKICSLCYKLGLSKVEETIF